MMTLDTLLAHPEQAASLTPEELAKLAMDATALVALLCHAVVQRSQRSDGEDLLSDEQVANCLGIGVPHAKTLIQKALPKITIGQKTVRVRRADLRQWIATRRVVRETRRPHTRETVRLERGGV